VRFRHFATVFGLIPYRSLSAWIEAFVAVLLLEWREWSWRFREVSVPQCLLGGEAHRLTTTPWD
jgi:hypothetical protein